MGQVGDTFSLSGKTITKSDVPLSVSFITNSNSPITLADLAVKGCFEPEGR